MQQLDLLHHVTDDHDFKNEDLLYRFRADDPSPNAGFSVAGLTIGCNVSKKGTVHVKAHIFGWREMYAVMRADTSTFYLFENERSSHPARVIEVPQCMAQVEEQDSAKKGHYGFVVTSYGQKVQLCTLRSKDQEEWLEAFMSAGAKFEEDKGTKKVEEKSVFEYSCKDIEGKERSLSEWKGKVLLIVNVASY